MDIFLRYLPKDVPLARIIRIIDGPIAMLTLREPVFL